MEALPRRNRADATGTGGDGAAPRCAGTTTRIRYPRATASAGERAARGGSECFAKPSRRPR